jgi:hypothetical protein
MGEGNGQRRWRGSSAGRPLMAAAGGSVEGGYGEGKGAGGEGTGVGAVRAGHGQGMGRPEVGDAPDRWVPPVCDRRERGR